MSSLTRLGCKFGHLHLRVRHKHQRAVRLACNVVPRGCWMPRHQLHRNHRRRLDVPRLGLARPAHRRCVAAGRRRGRRHRAHGVAATVRARTIDRRPWRHHRAHDVDWSWRHACSPLRGSLKGCHHRPGRWRRRSPPALRWTHASLERCHQRRLQLHASGSSRLGRWRLGGRHGRWRLGAGRLGLRFGLWLGWGAFWAS